MRNPARTASTAAALMIGLALVTMVATLGEGLITSDKDSLRHQLRSDYVVTSKNGWDPLSRAPGDAAAAAPGVTLASSVRNERAIVQGDEVRVDGIEPTTMAAVYRYDWVQGSNATLGTLGRDGTVIREKWSTKHHVAVGDRIVVTNPAGRKSSYVVRGIYTQLVTKALSDQGVSFVIPSGLLVVFVVVAIVAGVLAAVVPARRASRLKVLQALQYE